MLTELFFVFGEKKVASGLYGIELELGPVIDVNVLTKVLNWASVLAKSQFDTELTLHTEIVQHPDGDIEPKHYLVSDNEKCMSFLADKIHNLVQQIWAEGIE